MRTSRLLHAIAMVPMLGRIIASRSESGYVRRRLIDCLDEKEKRDVTLTLPDQLVENLAYLEEMVSLVAATSTENPGGYDTFETFCDIDDKAIVARRKNKCFATFQATIALNPLDIFQLFDWGRKEMGNCVVRSGIYNAYYSTYVHDFVAAVDECMMSGSDTELFLTGHSQGNYYTD